MAVWIGLPTESTPKQHVVRVHTVESLQTGVVAMLIVKYFRLERAAKALKHSA